VITTHRITPDTLPPASRSGGARVAWLVLGALLAIASLGWGTLNVVELLAHEEFTVVDTVPAAGLRSVVVDSGAGSATIVGSARDDVRITAHVSEGLRHTGYGHEVVGDTLHIGSTCPIIGSTWCGVSYTVEVPAAVALRVDTDNGHVAISGVDGPLDVSSDNGRMDLSGPRGDLDLSSDNGRIEAIGATGANVHAKADNGRIHLVFAAAPTTVEARSDNGSIEIVVPDDGSSYAVDVDTDGGDRQIGVRADPTSPRTISAHSDNGSVTIRYATP
jgi:hypothetical protein